MLAVAVCVEQDEFKPVSVNSIGDEIVKVVSWGVNLSATSKKWT